MLALLIYCLEDPEGWPGAFDRDMERVQMALSKTKSKSNVCVYARYRSGGIPDADKDVLCTKDGCMVARIRHKRSPNDLRHFLRLAAQRCSFSHTVLFIQSHAAYWYISDKSHTDRDADKFVVSITSIKRDIQQTIGRLDAICFDSCLMATLENAVELHGTVRYLLASEVAVYTQGFLSAIKDFSEPRSIPDWLTSLAQRYVRLNKTVYTDASVLDLRHVPQLLQQLPPMKAFRIRGIAHTRIYRKYKNYISYDLWQIMQVVKPSPAFERAFRQVVILYRQTPRLKRTLEHTMLRGLSVCIYPERSDVRTELPRIHTEDT